MLRIYQPPFAALLSGAFCKLLSLKCELLPVKCTSSHTFLSLSLSLHVYYMDIHLLSLKFQNLYIGASKSIT